MAPGTKPTQTGVIEALLLYGADTHNHITKGASCLAKVVYGHLATEFCYSESLVSGQFPDMALQQAGSHTQSGAPL